MARAKPKPAKNAVVAPLKCDACLRVFRPNAAEKRCQKCASESRTCANCGEDPGEFLCLYCVRNGEPRCEVCMRPPVDNERFCAHDKAAFEAANLVPAGSITPIAADYNTSEQFDAEARRSWEAAAQ